MTGPVRLGRAQDGSITPGFYVALTGDGVTSADALGLELAGVREGDAGGRDAIIVREEYLLPDEDVVGDLIGQLLMTAAAHGMRGVVDRARRQLAYCDEHWPAP